MPTKPSKIDTVSVQGRLSIVVTDQFGNIKEDRLHKNLVMDLGKDWIAARMLDAGIPDQMSHMGVGSAATDPSDVTKTALVSEITRIPLTSALDSDVATTQYICEFGEGVGTGAIVEAGIFNAATAGLMLCRTTFPVVNKGVNDTVTITWNISII